MSTHEFEMAPFKFHPQDYVTVMACGVGYRGRVLRCIWEGERGHLYDVQYVDDRGEFKRGEFAPDELEARRN